MASSSRTLYVPAGCSANEGTDLVTDGKPWHVLTVSNTFTACQHFPSLVLPVSQFADNLHHVLQYSLCYGVKSIIDVHPFHRIDNLTNDMELPERHSMNFNEFGLPWALVVFRSRGVLLIHAESPGMVFRFVTATIPKRATNRHQLPTG